MPFQTRNQLAIQVAAVAQRPVPKLRIVKEVPDRPRVNPGKWKRMTHLTVHRLFLWIVCLIDEQEVGLLLHPGARRWLALFCPLMTLGTKMAKIKQFSEWAFLFSQLGCIATQALQGRLQTIQCCRMPCNRCAEVKRVLAAVKQETLRGLQSVAHWTCHACH